MNSVLNSSIFFNLQNIRDGQRVPPTVFGLLGSSLKSWLMALLVEKGVASEPVILSKDVSPQAHIEGPVYIEVGAKVEAFAFIKGPAYIAAGAEIRHAAYIRGDCYIGPNAVVGHTTEVKGSIFFDHAKAGHFAYIGDSILGHDVNLGAGTKLANLKFKGNEVKYTDPQSQQKCSSGLRKFGSIIGDGAQTGCNAVLDPGTLLLPHTAVMPCIHYRGTLVTGIAK